jgi:hypothetical protein
VSPTIANAPRKNRWPRPAVPPGQVGLPDVRSHGRRVVRHDAELVVIDPLSAAAGCRVHDEPHAPEVIRNQAVPIC